MSYSYLVGDRQKLATATNRELDELIVGNTFPQLREATVAFSESGRDKIDFQE